IPVKPAFDLSTRVKRQKYHQESTQPRPISLRPDLPQLARPTSKNGPRSLRADEFPSNRATRAGSIPRKKRAGNSTRNGRRSQRK
ncbi:hypothetical protein K0M31_002426, partial [Melipona bicolor]